MIPCTGDRHTPGVRLPSGRALSTLPRLPTAAAGINRPVLREGPIPRFVHGVVEYAAAVVLIIAPFVLGFDADAAIAVSIVAGVAILVVAASTTGPTSLVDQLPLSMHVFLDYVLAALLIAVPFLFGFSDESEATAFFIALGVIHLLMTIGTRFRPAEG